MGPQSTRLLDPLVQLLTAVPRDPDALRNKRKDARAQRRKENPVSRHWHSLEIWRLEEINAKTLGRKGAKKTL